MSFEHPLSEVECGAYGARNHDQVMDLIGTGAAPARVVGEKVFVPEHGYGLAMVGMRPLLECLSCVE